MPSFFLSGLLAGALLALADQAQAAALQYRVSGVLSQHLGRQDAAERGEFVSLPYSVYSSVFSFVVTVNECRWSVELAPTKLPNISKDDSHDGKEITVSTNWNLVVASDGNEFCSVMGGTRSRPDAVFGAMRGRGAAPFCVDENIILLWYAYASHCLLRDSTSNLVVPMEYLQANPKVFRVPAHWELFPAFPALPRVVKTFGYWINPSNGSLEMLPPENARTNAILEVHSTTNLSGISLPLQTSVYRYLVTLRDGRVASMPHYKIVIETTSVELGAKLPEYPPQLSGPYHVSDYRASGLSNAAAVKIITTQGWPSESLVKSKAQAAANKRRYLDDPDIIDAPLPPEAGGPQ
jgi:hypothetical protein